MKHTRSSSSPHNLPRQAGSRAAAVAILYAAAFTLSACTTAAPPGDQRTFAAPEEAARGLIEAAKSEKVEDVIAFFGPEGKALLESGDPVAARRNRQVFVAAAKEKWHLEDNGETKVLVIGNEQWPFPVPLVKGPAGWKFDTAAGKEEIISRRIGRNELAAIRVARTYVVAQRLYARQPHDGKPAGRYAVAFRSDPGRQNGLYWAAARGERRSPLGDLVAQAADERAAAAGSGGPSPFHGYYFKILTAQGEAATGGAKSYIVNGELSGGFALVAWPAQYDTTGVMSFVINQDGSLREKDLGPETAAAAQAMTTYNPDQSWSAVQ